MSSASALGFLSSDAGDLSSRLARLRWRRAIAAAPREISPATSARIAFSGSELWVVVREPAAIPVGARGRVPLPSAGRILVAETRFELDPPVAHTLRELETSAARGIPEASPEEEPPALAFRPSDFPSSDETAEEYVAKLLRETSRQERDEEFLALRLKDPSEEDRPELTALLDPAPRRLLDVGCGSGGASGALKARFPATNVTGVEKNSDAARRARTRLDRVLEGDADSVLERLRAAGERFDSFLFADVLEHLEDPIQALALAKEVASRGAKLVASIPNVGHLSICRDLLLGRFDPVPAGLCDAGHLRWFTRTSIQECFEEAGWLIDSMRSAPGAPAPEGAGFLAHFSAWPELDLESLLTYQWIVVAESRAQG